VKDANSPVPVRISKKVFDSDFLKSFINSLQIFFKARADIATDKKAQNSDRNMIGSRAKCEFGLATTNRQKMKKKKGNLCGYWKGTARLYSTVESGRPILNIDVT